MAITPTPAVPTPITERLATATKREGGRVTFIGTPDAVDVPWAQIHDEARAAGASLQALGVAPGDHVAILGPTSRALVTAVQGCWLAGAASMVLPLPMRMASLDEFVTGTRNRIRHGDAKLLLIDDALAAFYEPAPGDPPARPLGDVLPGAGRPGADALEIPAPDPERLVILQYTSGSTSEPKGVMLPDAVLGANIDAIVAASEFDADHDVVVSWLPLYHDMGLVGLLTAPMTIGARLILAGPQDFLAKPGHWMQWLSDYRGTVTAGPNFSWVLAARALRRMHDLDLSPVRVALNGAEPIDPDAVDEFVTEAQRFGFRPGAVFCAFGMAELAIGGTFPPPMRGMLTDAVDRIALEEKGEAISAPVELATTRRLPLLGRPVPGLEVRIVDPATGECLAEREVGELLIRGTSVTPGYYKRPDATAELLHDGWLHTGDLAYLLDGELVLCGRIKDVIIVGGRNVFPEDIERAVGEIDGVRKGNVIAFGVEGYKSKETVVVVAETKAPADQLDALRYAIHHRTLEVSGLPPRDVMLVQSGTLPKTSSGKLQRSLCKQQYLEELLQLA